jgi:hypothetical protein
MSSQPPACSAESSNSGPSRAHACKRNSRAACWPSAASSNTAAARDLAVVVLQLMKAANALSDEEALPGRAAAQRELQALTVQYLKHHLPA